MTKLKQKLRPISVGEASKKLQKATVITGPSRLDYIEIENRRIWLFGDRHADHVKPKHSSVRLDEWVSLVVSKYPNENFDFFVESPFSHDVSVGEYRKYRSHDKQGVLSEVDQSLGDCLMTNKKNCPFKNLRVHFIEFRCWFSMHSFFQREGVLRIETGELENLFIELHANPWMKLTLQDDLSKVLRVGAKFTKYHRKLEDTSDLYRTRYIIHKISKQLSKIKSPLRKKILNHFQVKWSELSNELVKNYKAALLYWNTCELAGGNEQKLLNELLSEYKAGSPEYKQADERLHQYSVFEKMFDFDEFDKIGGRMALLVDLYWVARLFSPILEVRNCFVYAGIEHTSNACGLLKELGAQCGQMDAPTMNSIPVDVFSIKCSTTKRKK
jgi:hypothetical protein